MRVANQASSVEPRPSGGDLGDGDDIELDDDARDGDRELVAGDGALEPGNGTPCDERGGRAGPGRRSSAGPESCAAPGPRPGTTNTRATACAALRAAAAPATSSRPSAVAGRIHVRAMAA